MDSRTARALSGLSDIYDSTSFRVLFTFAEVHPARIAIDRTIEMILITERGLLIAIYSKFAEYRYLA